MTLLSAILIALGTAYCLLLFAYRWGWVQEPEWIPQPETKPETKVSVIVPARNEALRITPCLDALAKQNYPSHLLEIVVVDDHSEDDTRKIIESYAGAGVRYLNLEQHLNGATPTSYKKAALDCGITNTTGELIVTTDADCVFGPDWIATIVSRYEADRPDMIIGPVAFSCDNSILQRFQQMDFMSMQGITVASHKLGLGHMCNGANLAFTRMVFTAVGGYAGIDHFVSGDDYLLMMKIAQRSDARIVTLKSQDAVVTTPPQDSWSAFLSQRIRWASKSGKYPDHKMTAILILVYLFNLGLLTSIGCGFMNPVGWYIFLALAVAKTYTELFFLRPVARFFGTRNYTGYFILLQPLHIVYIVASGFLGLVGRFEWKGRKTGSNTTKKN